MNVDETWIGMSDFRRRKWCRHRHINSVAQLQIMPRISMICGLDTNGELYLSLVQANSNSSVMQIFFTHLIKLLDSMDAKWRNTYIILLDNAPYHRSRDMLKFLEANNIPCIFTGPHSYDASPIELFFAHFKAADINPRNVKTGKK